MLPAMGSVEIAAVAALVGDPARAGMLDALMDGRARPAGELARLVGIAPSTASGHLSRLRAGQLVVCEVHGREHRYRLASPETAALLEALARVAPPTEIRSLRSADRAVAMLQARTCYDHLAGRVGLGITEALVQRGALVAADKGYALTAGGEARQSRPRGECEPVGHSYLISLPPNCPSGTATAPAPDASTRSQSSPAYWKPRHAPSVSCSKRRSSDTR
jgi:DNA-binding transcriptional ArsR family regulator